MNQLTIIDKKHILTSKIELFVITVFMFFLVICANTANGQQPKNDDLDKTVKNENYRIGPGDVIDVIIGKNELLSRSGIRVNNQGMIQLPMIDTDVPAACFTERELADQIKERYKKYLLDPHVNVAVKEFNSTPVALIGAVITPMRLQLQRPMRLLEVLSLGNGPSATAGRNVQVIRNYETFSCTEKVAANVNESSDELISFALADTLKGSEQSNPFVQAGDIIRVVEADQVQQAYIIGNVKSAKAIDLKDAVTLTQAIAMAGGTSEGAQTEKVKISRQVPGSLSKTELLVNLKAINQRKTEDVLIQPNDIIDIPGPSGTKKFFRDILKNVIPTITRFPLP